MNKSLKISATIHAAAKLAAVQQGLKLQEFVEAALRTKLETVRERLEREAREAWEREERALVLGDLVLIDGIPVARRK